jgi:hypothetical protein
MRRMMVNEAMAKAIEAIDPQKQLREILAFLGDGLYWTAVDWGNPGDAQSAFQEMIGRIQGAEIGDGQKYDRLAALHEQHAQNIVRLTGDLEQARALWRQWRELARKSPYYREGSEPECPSDIHESFK